MAISLLHGKHFQLRLPSQRIFQGMDKIHQPHRSAAADIVHRRGNALVGNLVKQKRDRVDDIVNIGEVARQVAVIEDPYRLPGENRPGKEHRGHIGPPPRAIDGEQAQARGGNAVQPGIDMRDEFVAAFRRGIQGDGVIDGIILAEGNFPVSAVDRA